MPSFGNAQDAWAKIKIGGEITYHSVTTSKHFDGDGEIIRRTQSESNGSTQQILTFFPGRFQLMAKDPNKLTEFNETNIHHIFMGEAYGSKRSEPILLPVKFSSESKTWEICDPKDGLILTQTSSASGESRVTATKSHLSMIQTRSPKDVEMEKILLAGIQKFGQNILDTRKAQDIKDGKTINEGDYFMPALLYNDKTYGLYLFTNWWTTKHFQNLPITSKYRFFDCTTKSWQESASKMEIQISDDNRVLLEDYEEDGDSGYFSYLNIPATQMEKFIKDPTIPTVFIGGGKRLLKSQNEETEIVEIITLKVCKAN